MILDPSMEESADFSFIVKFTAEFDENESVKLILINTAIDLSRQLSNLTMNDNFKPYINVSLFSLKVTMR